MANSDVSLFLLVNLSITGIRHGRRLGVLVKTDLGIINYSLFRNICINIYTKPLKVFKFFFSLSAFKMFWKFNLMTTSHIDTLLDKEVNYVIYYLSPMWFSSWNCEFSLFILYYFFFQDVTLRELMDEEDILQECKSQNSKLIELWVSTFKYFIDYICKKISFNNLLTSLFLWQCYKAWKYGGNGKVDHSWANGLWWWETKI